MANGFIILKEGTEFYTRYTGYDMIINIAIHELRGLENSEGLIDILQSKIPAVDKAKGDAVFHNAAGEMVHRILDLTTLSQTDEALFWQALKTGRDKLFRLGSNYSNLNPTRLKELLELRHQITDES